VHLMGVYLMGVQRLMDVHLINGYFMDVYMLNLIFRIQKGFRAKLVIPHRTRSGKWCPCEALPALWSQNV